MTMQLIETKTLGTAAASIEFTSIPQDGTDLVAFVSARTSAFTVGIRIAFNTGGTYSVRRLNGSGSGTSTDTSRDEMLTTFSGDTANAFSSGSLYVPNYTSSNAKAFSADSVTENNATQAFQLIMAGLWSGTSAVTSLTFTTGSGNFTIGTTISLYKITKGSGGATVS
jgi:hypothetical protein